MATAPFSSVLCAIEPGSAAREAARQAVALAAPDGRVRFICVSPPDDDTAEDRQALSDAVQVAETESLRASASLLEEDDAVEALLRHTAPGELLAVGAHGASRWQGIVGGSVATEIVHRARGPVLVARKPSDSPFARRILVASDGSEESRAAAEIAARIARAKDAVVGHLHVGTSDPERRRAMAAETAMITLATGTEPVVVDRDGDPVDEIVAAADDLRASLIVVGSRGLSGVRALASVSERVVHQARCSVLVAR